MVLNEQASEQHEQLLSCDEESENMDEKTDKQFLEESWISRSSIVFTIPHLIALVSLLILGAYVVITIRSETARQQSSDDFARRCAFVYLVASNKTNVDNLGFSLQSLNKYVRVETNYRIMIVHEDIPPVVQGRLQSLSEASLHFHEFNLKGPSDFNNSGTLPIHNGEDARKKSQDMIRFWFYSAMLPEPSKAGLFAEIDYIVRLDSDYAFTGQISTDFLKDFARSGMQYGYRRIGEECNWNKTYSLRHLAESYVELNGISPRSEDLWNSLVTTKRGECLPKFENYFEVINLRFFKSHSGIQDWIKVVDTNGGIYRDGWDDSVLRFVTVALYAAPEKLVAYETSTIPYSNSQRDGRTNQ